MLVIKNLSKQFHGKKILDNISLAVKPGEVAVLIGPSGVGKSTLLRTLNNLETIDHGSVTLNNRPLNLKKVNQDHICGMVFQSFNLFEHLTVEQNITLALEKVIGNSKQKAKKTALDLLKRYGLLEKANEYPSQLSGGQKQRLAIARTIAMKPKIICFDEPTSALDPLLTTHIAKTIQQLANEGYIIVIASHDTSLLDKLTCNIYLMSHGTIIESAHSEEFFANQSAYPQLERFVAGHIE